MTYSVAPLVVLFLVVLAVQVWAGPIDEVLGLEQFRSYAFVQGDINALMANYAEDAVVHPLPLLSAPYQFRLEGKREIREYYAAVFRAFPERRVFTSQSIVRVYNNDLVLVSAFALLSHKDSTGQLAKFPIRYSRTWAKVGGHWQIVDHHTSPRREP